ncbi:MAG: TonB-dependent receptor [Xanthomonadales bacterium]|nr:TonB-dependent receptor [Xanthomonadales bacterium]NIN58339.1 TonB-dependent receptor [Xanthomonadales bacterium]NIN73678.1 TonB-dependent receptor [Xanthomonadales bacterium]NIO14469.1 TonB-dependent receptor [Xanthomonadales bacterium]NIP10732.1 TonB-dependent receptor [Xanthomonadales bacterium]
MKIITKPLVTLLSLVVAAPIAYAQSEAMVEEVVVTARKRDESFTEIPVSLKAFTESEIQSAGIETPQDFIDLTPNVTLVQTQNAGNSFINIRGVSQARNSEMSAAVLIDGVLMPNPAQFNQQLFDVEQIEVLRGPQGALYGRNAIGGAITIVTKQPSDEFEGKFRIGGDSGPGFNAQAMFSGPLGSSETLKYRVSASYMDTDGYINNPYLGEEADPFKDKSLRAKLLWEPNDQWTADFRFYISELDTQALYFNIAAEADDTSLPVRVNNRGTNDRDIYSVSLKLDFEADWGTFTSITSFDSLEELLTGDNFDFLPRADSWLNGPFTGGFGPYMKFLTGEDVVDLSQTQFLDQEAWSQEFRFTSPADNRLRWIAGAYFIGTERYISTGNQVDLGNGVFKVTRTPRFSVFCYDPNIAQFFPSQCAYTSRDPSPQIGLLVDEQDNLAWAVFADVSYDISDALELSVSLRYDEDERENTTLTEPLYDPTFLGLVPGSKRKETWDELQPKVTLRYKSSDNTSWYAGYSRGFRSGGFNQTGVGGAVPFPNIDDIFDAQIADTYEAGFKTVAMDGRFVTSASVFYTDFEGAYFFFYDAGTSTQNLGSIDEATYTGFEWEGTVFFTDSLSAYFGIGYTDSEIDKFEDPAFPDAPRAEGNQAPLVSEYTLNLGGTFRHPMQLFGGKFGETYGFARVDYQRIGDTWWDPYNLSVRSPINIVDFRFGVDADDDWSLVLWIKNAFDEEYNTEFSPGPALFGPGVNAGTNFLWKGMPRHWGVDFTKRF